MVIELKFANKTILLAVIYRPPIQYTICLFSLALILMITCCIDWC